MAIIPKETNRPLEVDLDGPDGNAFYLLGLARKISTLMGMEEKEIEEIQTNMKSKDYTNLVQIFENVFGDYVILTASDKTLQKLNLSPKEDTVSTEDSQAPLPPAPAPKIK